MAKKYVGKIRVGSGDYKIYKRGGLVTEEGAGALGKAHHIRNRIVLSSGYKRQRTYRTFWHELIHCIEYERGLDLEEREVDQIAMGIVELFKDNPHLIEMVIQGKFIEESELTDKIINSFRITKGMTALDQKEQVKPIDIQDELNETIQQIVNGKITKKVDKRV